MVVGDFPLRDKIVAVTGGGSGIGLAFAQLATFQHNKVVIFDLALSPQAQAWIDERRSIGVAFFKGDVTKWAELQNLITFSESTFGDVPDVYIAGAGIFEKPSTSFWGDDEPERYLLADINLHPIKLTRLAMRALIQKNKKGVVIVVSSMAGIAPFYPVPLYSATKAALIAFTKSLLPADEEEGIKVACICPGAVETPLWTSEIRDQWSMRTDKCSTSSDIAHAILELVQNGSYGGGSIMMATTDGNVVLPREEYWEQYPTWKPASEPIRATLAKERGAGP